MALKTKHNEAQAADFGAIVIYQTQEGRSALDVRLQDETLWLKLDQMAELFARDKSVISRHLRNIFQTGELDRAAVVAKNATTAADGKTYQVEYYNLDAIISVGYRVNSKRGTNFRIWATSVLRDHLVRGYSLNQRRLLEKGEDEVRQLITLLNNTLEQQQLLSDEGRAILDIVSRYAKTWRLLLQYDEESLPIPEKRHKTKGVLEIEGVRQAIAVLKGELRGRGEAVDLFGQERCHGLAGILGAVFQTFGGEELYPSVEEKAAHLLYFVIKDHPFTDGNKRIGSLLFLLILAGNGMLDERVFGNQALVALALLVAASDPGQKALLIRLILNLLPSETIAADAKRTSTEDRP